MSKFAVNRFKKGSWLSKSNSLLGDKVKVLALVGTLTGYLKKGGLEKVRDDLKTLGNYISDIMHGRYKGYSKASLTLAVAAVLYVVSPLDLVPDFLPLGFLDDVSIVGWAISKMADELEKYKAATKLQRKEGNEPLQTSCNH